MGMSGYKAFNDETVRAVKANLVKGVTVSAIARAYGVSTETISRIRRGLTYVHVRVEGEEKLRPPVELVAADATAVRVMARMTEEQEEAGMEELRKHLEGQLATRESVTGMLEEMEGWTEEEQFALKMGAGEEALRAMRKK